MVNMKKLFSLFKRNSSKDDNNRSEFTTIVRYSVERNEEKMDVPNGSTPCEEVCLRLCHEMKITPTMMHCFSLAMLDGGQKFTWLSWSDQIPYGATVHFRMRFYPIEEKCNELIKVDSNCLQYLLWQLKWDFLNEMLPYYSSDHEGEARGLSVLFMLLVLQMKTGLMDSTEVDAELFFKDNKWETFLPKSLQKTLIEKIQLESSMKKKLKEYQQHYPNDTTLSENLELAQNIVAIILKKYDSNYIEEYTSFLLKKEEVALPPDEENDEIQQERYVMKIVDKKKAVVQIKMGGETQMLSFVDEEQGKSCEIRHLSKVEINEESIDGEDWVRVCLYQDHAAPQNLYFNNKLVARSFVSCLETYSRLTVDFYNSHCEDIQPQLVKHLSDSRCHGPVSDEFVKAKLQKCGKDFYVIRSSQKVFDEYEVLHMSNELRIIQKIRKNSDGFVIEGFDPVPDISTVRRIMITNGRVPKQCIAVKPQYEACDILQKMLVKGNLPRVHVNIDKSKQQMDTAPVVYLPSMLSVHTLIGKGFFSEVHKAVLNEQEQVVVKRLRDREISSHIYKEVEEAFHTGLNRYMELYNVKYFMKMYGLSLTRPVSFILQWTELGSLTYFLQSPHEDPLTLSHLVDVAVHLANILLYMHDKNITHGNLHCNNVMVTRFNRQEMMVKLTDPGLVSFYNKQTLTSHVNTPRLPWLAPELLDDLNKVTIQTEVFAYGTTLWQMFSRGRSPLEADPELNGKSPNEILAFFRSKSCLSEPEFLKKKHDDSNDIQRVKTHILDVIKKCWTKDSEDRLKPAMLLKEINSTIQSYGGDYHDYNVIYESSSVVLDTSSTSEVIYNRVSMETDQASSRVPVADFDLLQHQDELQLQGAAGGVAFTSSETPGQSKQRPQLPKLSNGTMPLDRHAKPTSPSLSPQPEDSGGQGSSGSLGRGLSPGVSNVQYLIPNSRLDIDRRKILGSGHYGEIYKGLLKPSGNTEGKKPVVVAIKVLKEDKVANFHEDFKKEAGLMEMLEHRNIVKFFGVSNNGANIVMEYVEKNSLRHYVLQAGENGIPTDILLKMSIDIATGMDYLGSKNIVHCDLAARNILLKRDLTAKVSDFGLAKVLSKDKNYYKRKSHRAIPLWWCAPEWIGFEMKFTSKSDVWSFGVVLWEMFSYGKEPYLCKHLREIYNQLSTGKRLPKPDHCSAEVYGLMQDCWRFSPEHRPSFSSCCERLSAIYRDHIASLESPEEISVFTPSMEQNNLRSKTASENMVEATNVSKEEINLETTINAHGSKGSKNVNGEAEISDDVPEVVGSIDAKDAGNGSGESSVTVFSRVKQPSSAPSLRPVNMRTGVGHHSSSVGRERDKIFIDKEDVEVDKKNKENFLGKGSFGCVYKAKYNGKFYAVKECSNEIDYKRFKREIEELVELRRDRHRNIVQLVGIIDLNDSHNIVMELLSGGSLKKHLKTCQERGAPEILANKLTFLTDIAKGMQYLQSKRVIHCDLTAENVLLDENMTAKISDFGLCKKLEGKTDNELYIRKDVKFKCKWAAPEVFSSQFMLQSDIWSYGVVCIEVFSDGKDPEFASGILRWDQKNEVMGCINSGERYPKPEKCPDEIYSIILKCWERNPEKRIPFSDIVTTIENKRIEEN